MCCGSFYVQPHLKTFIQNLMSIRAYAIETCLSTFYCFSKTYKIVFTAIKGNSFPVMNDFPCLSHSSLAVIKLLLKKNLKVPGTRVLNENKLLLAKFPAKQPHATKLWKSIMKWRSEVCINKQKCGIKQYGEIPRLESIHSLKGSLEYKSCQLL